MNSTPNGLIFYDGFGKRLDNRTGTETLQRESNALSGAELSRLNSLAARAFEKVIEKKIYRSKLAVLQNLSKLNYYEFKENLVDTFRRELLKRSDSLIEAARLRPSVAKTVDEIERRKRNARTNLARELKSSRAKLAEVHRRIEEEYSKLRAAQGNRELFGYTASPYPDPPGTIVPEPPNSDGVGLPDNPGIYFLWEADGVCAYVGQSVNLRGRVRLSHEHLKPTDKISFIETSRRELTWTESFYIGLLRPYRNGGSHRRYKVKEQ